MTPAPDASDGAAADAIPLAPADGGPLGAPYDAMLADYRAARALPPVADAGRHWSGFRSDFDRLIRTVALWPRFRRFGVSYGFDDTQHAGAERLRPELRPADTACAADG